MFRLPLIRYKPWKKGFSLPDTPDLPRESGIIPYKFETWIRSLLAPGAYFLLSSLMQEWLEESFTRTNKVQIIWVCVTNLVFHGAVAGIGISRGILNSNLFLAAVPLSVSAVYSVDQESWMGYVGYMLGQVFLGFRATKFAVNLQIAPWIIPGFLSIIFLNAAISLHILFKLSNKERYILKMGHMLNDMQELKYSPSNYVKN